MRTSSILALAAAVAPAVLAAPYFTSPIGTTSCTGGQPCTVSWKDDGNVPLLAAYGDCTIGVYAGSQNEQSLMQAISPANAASTASVIFTVDPGMGENSNAYFIKMISTTAADPTQPTYKATAYSAMFTLTGMTGTFNQTVKSQVAGTAASSGVVGSGAPATTPAASAGVATPASTMAPVASTMATASTMITSAVSGASSASHATSSGSSASHAASSGSSGSHSASAASSSSTATANGASGVAVAGMGVFGATVAAVLAAFL